MNIFIVFLHTCNLFLLSRLHKPKPVEPARSEMSESEQTDDRDDVFAELEELMGPDADTVIQTG